jgi:hypothetical protein
MHKFSKAVIEAFFQQFYDERIKIAKKVGSNYHKQLDTSLLSFWFSVIDFYGGIYFIGKNNKKIYKNKKLKLADKETFAKFILDFPAPENELGDFLYSVFRSGLISSTLSQKRRDRMGETNPNLLWVKIKIDNNKEEKVATLNIYQLEKLAYAAYINFKQLIENDELFTECEKIYNTLLAIPDGLEDGMTIDKEYSILSEEVKAYITIKI